MPDLVDALFREAPGVKLPKPSPWAEMPLWRVLVWDGFWWAAAIQWLVWPVRPRTAVGAALAFVLVASAAVPFALLRRRFPNYFYDNPIAMRVKARTAHVPGVSGERLGYLLGAMGVLAVVYAAIVAVVWLIAPSFEPLKPFVGRHIY